MTRYGSTDARKSVDDEKHPNRKDIAIVVSCCLLGAAALAFTAPTRPQLASAVLEATTASRPPQLLAAAAASEIVTGCECTLGACCARGPVSGQPSNDDWFEGGCTPLITGFVNSDMEVACAEVAAGNRSGATSVCEVEEVRDGPLGYTLSVSLSSTCAELKGQCTNASAFDINLWSRPVGNVVGCTYSMFTVPLPELSSDGITATEDVVIAIGGPETCGLFDDAQPPEREYEVLPVYYKDGQEGEKRAKDACAAGDSAEAYLGPADDASTDPPFGVCFDMSAGSVTVTVTGGPWPCTGPSTPIPTHHKSDSAAATTATAAAFLLPALLV